MKMKANEKMIISKLLTLFGLIWLGSWFATIWVDGYRLQLFFTGVFFLFLASVMQKLEKDSTNE